MTRFRIDPAAPDAIQTISDGPILTEFSKRQFTLLKNSAGQHVAVPIEK
jgi:hypothetical protein